jgi:uncharacterized protein (DUF302 family)
MRKNIKIYLGFLAAFISGALLVFLLAYNMAEKMMLLEDRSVYGFEETIVSLEESIIKSGWKIPVVHDLQETMASFGKEVDEVVVYELCHPEHAYRILKEGDERIVSALMPCRVAVYKKKDGYTYISRMNSGLMGKMMSGVVPEVMGIASLETEEILKPLIGR